MKIDFRIDELAIINSLVSEEKDKLSKMIEENIDCEKYNEAEYDKLIYDICENIISKIEIK